MIMASADGVLDGTDVLLWWGHADQQGVDDTWVQAVRDRVLDGMGFIALHSSLNSKPFRALIGTSCRSAGFRHGDGELVWTASAAHPITDGIPSPIIVPDSEMYSEPFDIAQLDDVVFISSFDGGEVFRSGITFTRGRGKIFYFAPGHEDVPDLLRSDHPSRDQQRGRLGRSRPGATTPARRTRCPRQAGRLVRNPLTSNRGSIWTHPTADHR